MLERITDTNKEEFKKQEKKYIDYVQQELDIPIEKVESMVRYRNEYIVYAYYKIFKAKSFKTVEDLEKYLKNKNMTITNYKTMDSIGRAITYINDSITENKGNRNSIYVGVLGDKNNIAKLTNKALKENNPMYEHPKLIIANVQKMDLEPKEEHEILYYKARRLQTPKYTTPETTYSYIKRNIRSPREMYEKGNSLPIAIRFSNKYGKGFLYEDIIDTLIEDIRAKRYDKILDGIRVNYRTQDGFYVVDKSKIRTLCLIYMWEDLKII